MIGKISGRVDYLADDHVLIEAGGVGYVVFCAPRTLAGLPRAGGRAALYTEMVVREDLMQLFGFPTLLEKEWHRLLTSVQGVGAKVSLAILGALGPEGVGRALALGDAGAFKRAPGVGPKLAQRIANELKDKAPNVMALGAAAARAAEAAPAPGDDASAGAPTPPAVEADAAGPDAEASGGAQSDASAQESAAARALQEEADALSALANLGYQAHEAATAVATAAQAAAAEGAEAGAAELIKRALKSLAKG